MKKMNAQFDQNKFKLVRGFKKVKDNGQESVLPNEVFSEFYPIIISYKKSLILILILVFFQAIIVGGSIWLVKYSLDLFFKNKDMQSVLYLIASLSFATLGKSVLEFLFAWNKVLIMGRIRDDIIVKAFKDLIYSPFHIHMKERDRKKFSWVLTDAVNITESIFGMFNSWIKQPFMVVSTITALLTIAPFLTLIGLVLFPLGIPCIIILKNRVKEIIAQRSHLFGMVEQMVSECIRCIRIIKVFGLEKSQIYNFEQIVDKQRGFVQQSAFYSGLIAPISELLGLIGLIIVILIGSMGANSHAFSTGTFFVFIISFVNIYKPLKEISNGMVNYQKALDAGRRLVILKNQVIKQQEDDDLKTVDQFHSLEIKQLWFSYFDTPKSEKDFVLKDLNLTIHKGDIIAIVGATGAGKSTLCDLILKLYRYQKGCIFLNHIPIENIFKNSLHQIFSLCSQETIIFNHSLFEDIRIACPDASKEEVMTVAEASGLAKLIQSLDQGIDTWVGNRGVHFSGGQRQMIALARALLKKPQFLILDEAISGVDVITSEKIFRNIKKIVPECTIVVVSHHLHMIQLCKRVVMLKDGSICYDAPVDSIKDPKQFFSNFLENT